LADRDPPYAEGVLTPALGIPAELRRAGGLEGLYPSHLSMTVKPIRLHPRGIVDRVKAVA
jgi:hypothetical protein